MTSAAEEGDKSFRLSPAPPKVDQQSSGKKGEQWRQTLVCALLCLPHLNRLCGHSRGGGGGGGGGGSTCEFITVKPPFKQKEKEGDKVELDLKEKENNAPEVN